jgi:hypothetical protein
MYASEGILFLISIVFTVVFIKMWYSPLKRAKPKGRNSGARFTLGLMPIFALSAMTAILTTVADPTVAESPFWVFYYILVGFAWLQCAFHFVFRCFDLSWIDDVVNKNRAEPALLPVIGCFFGLTLIYSGANIGEGPGWWCVIYAVAAGTIMWFFYGHILHKTTDVFSTITISRDLPCAIRMGAYLLASGAILAYASAGDSVSPAIDIINIFACSLAAIPLMILAIIVEKHYAEPKCTSKNMACSFSETGMKCTGKFPAFMFGAVYFTAAIVSMFIVDHIMSFMENNIWA